MATSSVIQTSVAAISDATAGVDGDVFVEASPSSRPVGSRSSNFTFREVRRGTRDPVLQAIFALRYQVYCIERRFLPAEDYPDGRETDEFDRHSSHFCAIDSRDTVIGAVRLVRPPITEPFPFQRRCGDLFDGIKVPPPESSAEVSRLVVSRNFRHRAGDLPEGMTDIEAQQKASSYASERRSSRPEIVLGLYRALYQYSRREGIRYWYAAMEQSLARALMRFNFEFNRIGPEADYFGPVAPYLASLEDLERRVGHVSEDLLRWFQGD
jgi:N-acyl amino acid synthase of PEP-CTERM/exosortase system